MLWYKQAAVLRSKAADDVWTMHTLAANAAAPLWVIGFHAQQAVEKYLKAVLCYRGIAFPYTHDIEEILKVVEEHNLDFPPNPELLTKLTTFAAMYRYHELHPPQHTERDTAIRELLQLVTTTQQWAESYLGPAPQAPPPAAS